ncbi:hypothetical protein C8D88_11670 [Lentzea atacamensis]|uniref:Uncharacterized protein n=1 Tax=Lentzea atacamensis TaxID=531938 RepID=A0A316I2L2_9PSEU|nr:hypothetical protein C8D88_11670 [Lentzea atacamensis]
MNAVLDHLPKARSEATLGRCCNPRPWEPLCVDCPSRFSRPVRSDIEEQQ